MPPVPVTCPKFTDSVPPGPGAAGGVTETGVGDVDTTATYWIVLGRTSETVRFCTVCPGATVTSIV